MKNIYIALFLVSLCAPLGMLFLSGRNQKENLKIVITSLRRVMLAVSFTLFFNMLTLVVTSIQMGMFVQALLAVSIDWLIYFTWDFVLNYTEIERSKLINLRLLRIMMYVDSVSLLLNQIFHHAFSCKKLIVSGETYIRVIGHPWYFIHLALVYLIILFIAITLVYRSYNAPVLYQKKYGFLLLILVIIVVANAVYFFKDNMIDVSMPLFGVGSLLTYYYAIAYLPEDFIKRSLSFMVKSMGDTVFLFDAEGRIIYANERAEHCIKKYQLEVRSYVKQLAEWCGLENFFSEKDFSTDKNWENEGKSYRYKIIFHQLSDKKNKHLGGCLIIQNRTEEYRKLQRERYLATHDRLTGVYNREYFYEQAEKVIRENPEETYLMICSDIRNFKVVNDLFGTEQADIVLQKVGKNLTEHSYPGDVYGRLVNDSFALLMQKKHYHEQTFIHEPEQLLKVEGDVTFPVRNYIGVYEVQPQDTSVALMCSRALLALETIKEDYNKRIAYYTEELRQKIIKEQELASALEEAIREKQFKVFLQPQITATGKLLGAEALIRWQHPKRGMIPPGEFIGLFERNGMIVRVDQYMWEETCRQLKEWRDKGWTDIYVSVNISPKDFLLIDIYECFTQLIKKYDIPPSALNLEITETSMMEDFDEKLKLIERLQQAGFTVEMDDFGSGYSSLNMLKNIDVDVLKVDMAFLGETNDEDRGKIILKSVVSMSKELGTTVIIEGVETKDQLELLKKYGCDIFQGYYFAKPMPVSQFEEMVQKQKSV